MPNTYEDKLDIDFSPESHFYSPLLKDNCITQEALEEFQDVVGAKTYWNNHYELQRKTLLSLLHQGKSVEEGKLRLIHKPVPQKRPSWKKILDGLRNTFICIFESRVDGLEVGLKKKIPHQCFSMNDWITEIVENTEETILHNLTVEEDMDDSSARIRSS